jgi:hypothetical protein
MIAKFSVQLLNSDYKMNSLVRRDELHRILVNQYKLFSTLETTIYQGINTKYAGGTLGVNEIVCTISPDGNLIGECYVKSKDIGLLKIGQTVRYQIDAFDYNYFGVLTGKIIAVDNDFSVINTASGTITMAANTGVTIVGRATVLTVISARFRIRRTAASTYILYRIG